MATTSNAGGARAVSGTAVAAMLMAMAAALAVLLAGPGTKMGLWDFRTGLTIFRWGGYASMAAGALSLIGGGVAHPASARRGFILAIGGMVISVAVLAVVFPVRQLAQSVPPIHDISTDTRDPPRFVAVLPLRRDASNPPEYAGPETAAKQREAYPDIQPERLTVPPAQAFERALNVARAMGWEIHAAEPKEGRIEATATTFWFGFKDDVVLRIRPAPGGSLLDVRSKSRVGRGDVGKNAARIRDYLEQLRQEG